MSFGWSFPFLDKNIWFWCPRAGKAIPYKSKVSFFPMKCTKGSSVCLLAGMEITRHTSMEVLLECGGSSSRVFHLVLWKLLGVARRCVLKGVVPDLMNYNTVKSVDSQCLMSFRIHPLIFNFIATHLPNLVTCYLPNTPFHNSTYLHVVFLLSEMLSSSNSWWTWHSIRISLGNLLRYPNLG